MNEIAIKRSITSVLMLSFLVTPSITGQEQELSLRQLTAELRVLHKELLAVRLELETGRIARLEKEHATAFENRQRLERRERTALEAVAHIERQLSSSEIDVEVRAQLQANHSEALDYITRERRQRGEAEYKESEIARQLRLARLTLAPLLERSKQHNTTPE